ncbi:hypothetical protein MJD09_22375 [bacterium]|nr:hypothetical protein [bacterium]
MLRRYGAARNVQQLSDNCAATCCTNAETRGEVWYTLAMYHIRQNTSSTSGANERTPRRIQLIVILPTLGRQHPFNDIEQAITFMEEVEAKTEKRNLPDTFLHFEVFLHYEGGNILDGKFVKREDGVAFLQRVKEMLQEF